MEEKSEKDDYIENLPFENKRMALFLEKLGYNNDAISLICNRDNVSQERVDNVTS